MRRLTVTKNGLKAEIHRILKDELRNFQMSSECITYSLGKEEMEKYLSKYSKG